MFSTNKFIFVLLLLFAALVVFVAVERDAPLLRINKTQDFVRARESEFVIGNQGFRFVGANVAIVYGETERGRMPETLADVSAAGVRVVRVWAHGEWDAASEGRAPNDWLRAGAFRDGRDGWNEAAFAHLDRTLAEAARRNLRVQICLANWWRDTGGVVQYLAWADDASAANAELPFGIEYAQAMSFYTNEEARRLYREHVRRIVTRRNTVTGILYADDPTIFAYELINEAQTLPGRDAERRGWVDEMSRYIKSLDANHLVTPGVWGYRTARERREWIADHKLPAVDFCDVHLYPRDDADSFADTPELMREFIENRMAAALHLRKPLVFGEWGMVGEGFNGVTQPAWFKNYFATAAQAGVAGASFWIVTADPEREYGIVFDGARDRDVHGEIKEGASLFAAMEGTRPNRKLFETSSFLVPHTESFTQPDATLTLPSVLQATDGIQLYRFAPESRARARFERLGGGAGYVWGTGVGEFEFVVPPRDGWRRVAEIVVRAHLQPVIPADSADKIKGSRVTLFINDTDCGSRLVTPTQGASVALQEWRITNLSTRLAAATGRALTIRFAVTHDADLPYGLNISNFPAGYGTGETRPLEVEIR